jgi:hypothetical protein
MMPKFPARVWNKLEPNFPSYPRLLWEVWIRRKQVVIVDFQGAMGDLVCFCASLPGLRERHPQSWVIFVTHRHYLELVRSTGLADVAAARYGFFHLFARRFCRAGNYYTPTAPPADPGAKIVNPAIHTAAHFAQLLGVEPRLDLVRLAPSRAIQSRIERRLAPVNPKGLPVVVVHTGPTWKVREWPAAYWHEWGEAARDLRACVIQIGTEDDSSALHAHAAARVPHAHDWVNRLTIMETVGLLERAQLFIGIDSGPLHLATTLGVATIGLFGPVNGHYRAHPRAAFTCLTANVPCLGCHHDPAGEGHWRISVDDVFRAAKDALAASGP